jgi:hypothetical protein
VTHTLLVGSKEKFLTVLVSLTHGHTVDQKLNVQSSLAFRGVSFQDPPAKSENPRIIDRPLRKKNKVVVFFGIFVNVCFYA